MMDEEDLFSQPFSNEYNSSSLNESERCAVEKIKNDLKKSSEQYQLSSITTSNDFTQEICTYINNFDRQEQQQDELLINDDNNPYTNSDYTDINIDDSYTRPEQISSSINEQHLDHMDKIHNDTPQNDQTLEPMTTDNAHDHEQQMNAFDYCCQLSEIFSLAVKTLEPTLVNLGIPVKTGDHYLQNLPIPSSNDINLTSQDPLNKLSNLFQTGIHLLSSFRQIYNQNSVHHTYPQAEELNETSERTTSDIQAPAQTKISIPTIPKNSNSTAIPISLSKLLSQAKTILDDLKLVKLEISEQPRQLWRKRSINCLKNRWCSAIQGQSRKQRRCIGIKWSKIVDYKQDDLFVHVQVLTYDNQPHPSNILVPAKTKVKQTKLSDRKKNKNKIRSTLKDLIINKDCGFDASTRTILCPITTKECKKCEKNLQVIMFSLYETSEEIFTEEDNSTDDDEDEENVNDELRKLCKLRITLCRRKEKGELVYISNSVDTDFIEQSKSSEPLKISAVTPTCLCKCGNDLITLTLNTDSEKNGFVIRLNNKQLKSDEIHGVTKKKIFFNSIPKAESDQKSLNIKISKKSILKTIEENHDPFVGLQEIHFPDINLDYVEHSNNPHEHKDSNDVELGIQSSEI